MKVECPRCGKEYQQLSQHWRTNENCDYPKLSKEQKDIIRGLLMGDATMNKVNESGSPYIKINLIKENYLEYIDGILSHFSTGVSLCITAEEAAEKNRSSGFSPNAKAEDYSDQYVLRTRSLPELQKFYNWYNSGQKKFPKNIRLPPKTLKHWYCCDGSLINGSSIQIAISNEHDEVDKINHIFEKSDLPKPRNYYIRERTGNNLGGIKADLAFGKEESKKIFEYIGSPPPGFEYKWPPEHRKP